MRGNGISLQSRSFNSHYCFFLPEGCASRLTISTTIFIFAVHEWRSQDTCSFIPEMPVDLGSGWEGVKPPFGGNRSVEFPLLGPAAAKTRLAVKARNLLIKRETRFVNSNEHHWGEQGNDCISALVSGDSSLIPFVHGSRQFGANQKEWQNWWKKKKKYSSSGGTRGVKHL